ncbi:MAG TPA: LysR family transcriptional regulator, partial [Burkholderiales bacterium]|nr:LysR family transcriptional regulator [Burkholderiales bacterium]
MIKLERVATFLAVAKFGGFREAAKKTGLSQPAVTQHVKRLEQSLNVNLIERKNVGSRLTPEGEKFLPYAETLMRTYERANALFKSASLVVGASSNIGIYLLQPYLKAYKDGAPHGLEVVIGTNASIADKLQNLEIDVAIMEWWDGRPGFASAPWRREDLVMIVPPDHPWSGMDTIPPDWLKGQQLLGGEASSGTGHLLLQHFGSD